MKKFILTAIFCAFTTVASANVEEWCEENQPDNPSCFLEQAISVILLKDYMDANDLGKNIIAYVCHTAHGHDWKKVLQCVKEVEGK